MIYCAEEDSSYQEVEVFRNLKLPWEHVNYLCSMREPTDLCVFFLKLIVLLFDPILLKNKRKKLYKVVWLCSSCCLYFGLQNVSKICGGPSSFINRCLLFSVKKMCIR